MKTELLWLTWTTILTALIWLPYVGDRMMVRGVLDTVGYPQEPKSQSPWANRMKAAHLNAIENLVVFATLVFVANAAGISNAATTFAAAFYFWARVVHLIAHTLGLPWVRTLGFAGGFVAQVIFAWQIVVH
jgi:uncharacterized MAPEG superfamily protein